MTDETIKELRKSNDVIDIELTNVEPFTPPSFRGIRYTFTNGWALSVHTTKRGGSHECAMLDKEGDISYTSKDEHWGDELIYLSSTEVIELINVMAQDVDGMRMRVKNWVADLKAAYARRDN